MCWVACLDRLAAEEKKKTMKITYDYESGSELTRKNSGKDRADSSKLSLGKASNLSTHDREGHHDIDSN